MTMTHVRAFDLRVRHFTKQLQYLMIVLALLSAVPVRMLAQDGHSQAVSTQQQTPDQRARANALVKIVREATERYKDVSAAEADGYALQFGCVSGPDSGAMGLHYVNGPLVNKGELEPLTLGGRNALQPGLRSSSVTC